MLYSKSKNGFFDPEIHGDSIPSDIVEVTDKSYWAIVDELTKGKVLQSDKNGYPVAVERPAVELSVNDKISSYERAAQKNLDLVAQSWGYDSLIAASSYANSTNSQYKAEAEALIEWRDRYWEKAYKMETGKLPDTAEKFVGSLPAAPSKPVI